LNTSSGNHVNFSVNSVTAELSGMLNFIVSKKFILKKQKG